MTPAIAHAPTAATALGGSARELQLITVRARLLLFRQSAWHETRASSTTPAWQDPWHDHEDLAVWADDDVRGRELGANLRAEESTIAGGVIELPHPDVPERLEQWRRAIAPLCGVDTVARLPGALPTFAAAVALSGAQIKLSVLAAVFAARRDGMPVEARHLVRSIERELVKDGRSLSERDRESLVRDVA